MARRTPDVSPLQEFRAMTVKNDDDDDDDDGKSSVSVEE